MTALPESVSPSGNEGPRVARVRATLVALLHPQRLDIQDDSHRHAHHKAMVRGPEAGATETHLRVHVVSQAFAGVSRVARSRMVHDALADELASGLHALALTLRTPEEERQLA